MIQKTSPEEMFSSSPLLPAAIPDPESSNQGENLQDFDARPIQPAQRVTSRFFPWWRFRSLRHGCYLFKFFPRRSSPFVFQFYHYEGTMRVERQFTNTIASGDLYYQSNLFLQKFKITDANPANGIPIYPRKNYRYYLRVTKILEAFTFGNSFTMEFERFLFNHSTNSWGTPEKFSAVMTWKPAPSGYPEPNDYLEGDLKSESGVNAGRITMGWVSPFLRKATIEADRVAQSESPANNGAGVDWASTFKNVGWDINYVNSQNNLAEVSGNSWSNAELHQQMLASRDSSNLDAQWRYHLLCVRRLDATSRGIMYDAFAGDSNNIPREGAAISSHWVIPNSDPWGNVKGQRFGTAPMPYFRTAVHEIGHAMGLYHNATSNGYMNTTGTIAASTGTFPNNIIWNFHPDDAKKLRHFPDPWVRPGMIPFGSSYSSAPISPNDDDYIVPEGIDLNVKAVMSITPFGAPVRLDMTLTNNSGLSHEVPDSISLKSEYVSGYAIDEKGTRRGFTSLIKCFEEHRTQTLKAKESIQNSMTLLRGSEGALFPSPGTYQIVVNICWDENDFFKKVSGSAKVYVSPPVDSDHAEVAFHVLDTPDTLLSLVLHGDHIEEGNEAIDRALKNPILAPHYRVIEAKRLATRFNERKADIKKAYSELKKDAVLSLNETVKMTKMITDSNEAGLPDAAKKVLKSYSQIADVSDKEYKKVLKKLK